MPSVTELERFFKKRYPRLSLTHRFFFTMIQSSLLLGVWSAIAQYSTTSGSIDPYSQNTSTSNNSGSCVNLETLKHILFLYMITHSFFILKETHDLTQDRFGYLTFIVLFYINSITNAALWLYSNYVLLSSTCSSTTDSATISASSNSSNSSNNTAIV